MGYEWNYRSLEGDVGARFAIGPVREGAGSLSLSLFLTLVLSLQTGCNKITPRRDLPRPERCVLDESTLSFFSKKERKRAD